MLGPVISDWAVGMMVEGTRGTDGTGGEGTRAVVARAGGLEPEAPQCALL